MTPSTGQQSVWRIVADQHNIIRYDQLRAIGYSHDAIQHRVGIGRLFVVHRGVYSVGTPHLTRHGELIAATFGCGEGAAISHMTAAELWELIRGITRPVHVSPRRRSRSRDGIRVHRRQTFDAELHKGIRVTTPAQTLIDLAAIGFPHFEAAINEADKRNLIHIEPLRAAAARAGRCGAALRCHIDRATFRMTDSELERWFLRVVHHAGLPLPETRVRVNGFKVDFYWPELGIVVETDGGTFHRTPSQQTNDRRRDQAHTRAGLIPLRFTHAQVRYEQPYVEQVLVDVVERTRRPPPPAARAQPARTDRDPRPARAARRRPPRSSDGP